MSSAAEIVTLTKLCTKCKAIKNHTEFTPRHQALDGLASWCQRCTNDIKNSRRNKLKSRERINSPHYMTCSKCLTEKHKGYFRKLKREPSGLDPFCRECRSASINDWRKNNPDKVQASTRRQRPSVMFRKYGLTQDAYDALWAAQGQKCAICRDKLLLDARSTHVDHDHNSGKVRGLLCLKCNPGLGAFKDDVQILEAAIVYLKRSRGAI